MATDWLGYPCSSKAAVENGILERNYIFEHEFGLWAFGTVQVLRERASGELRLCKVVPKASLRSNTGTIVNALGKLRDLLHAHICSVKEIREDMSCIYIICEKCAGDLGELAELLACEESWLEEDTCVNYIRQTLVALAHSHSCHVYHRDLRPGSLALTSKMADATVKVCGLGLATVLDGDDTQARREASPYLAPEVLERTESSSVSYAAADVWSVGAIAHSLLVGHPPSEVVRRQSSSHTSALWAINAGAILVGLYEDEEGWDDRSEESREFVRFLLQPPDSRPTAARALMHPWLQARALSSDLASPPCRAPAAVELQASGNGEVDAYHKRLCYLLALLLVPALLKYRDSYMLRVAFSHIDSDCDGLVSLRDARRLLARSRTCSSELVAAACDCIDVLDTGVVDLCSTLCADVLLAELTELGTVARGDLGPDLVNRMVKRFFDVYGPKVTTQTLRSRVGTATGKDVESHCGVSYECVLEQFPENVPLDDRLLISGLLANGGEGTPLAGSTGGSTGAGLYAGGGESDTNGFDWLLDRLFKGVFCTCGSEDLNCRTSGGLAADCDSMTRRCSHES